VKGDRVDVIVGAIPQHALGIWRSVPKSSKQGYIVSGDRSPPIQIPLDYWFVECHKSKLGIKNFCSCRLIKG